MTYTCFECGYRSIKRFGRCPRCGAWDSMQETKSEGGKAPSSWLGEDLRPISELDLADVRRTPTGMSEFDRLLGGGLVPGAVVLFGGEPGIGKSTLLLQVCEALAANVGPVLYVSGEESEGQVKLRASRLGVNSERLYVLSEQTLDRIEPAIEQVRPHTLVVDSVQTMRCGDVDGEAGSVRQLRAVTGELIRITKKQHITTFLVGHITKEGSFAGPKTVEHLVDVAVYLEGDRGEDIRMLRSVKNRFGATNEVAVFQMDEDGLTEINDPSQFFLTEREDDPRAGAAIVPVLEGTRPILVELQALVSPTGGYGIPQRRCTGLDVNRILLLLAVIDRRLAIPVGGADVYLSVAGGLTVRERAADLAAIAAIVSSLRNRALPPHTALVGEVDLAGEVRRVQRLPDRVREAAKSGYRRILVPGAGAATIEEGIDVVPVSSIERAIAELTLE